MILTLSVNAEPLANESGNSLCHHWALKCSVLVKQKMQRIAITLELSIGYRRLREVLANVFMVKILPLFTSAPLPSL
jgi:hypothetical protein